MKRSEMLSPRLKMSRFWPGQEITSSWKDLVWHRMNGETLDFPDSDLTREPCWCRFEKRGVQFLDRYEIPKSQRRYVYSPRFEVRWDTSFEVVVRLCATRERTWLTEKAIQAYIGAYEKGYAHSYEAWQGKELVAGGFGVHIGSYFSIESLFHTVSNASKAMYGRTLDALQKAGVEMLDTTVVARHAINYGEEWLAQSELEWWVSALTKRVVKFNGIGSLAPWVLRTKLHYAKMISGVL